MKKRTVLLLTLLCILLTAAACGREKDPGKPGSGDVTKGAEENQPGETPRAAVTPTPTQRPTPTPSPTPTPEALPEGFPASAELTITPKYTRDEIVGLMGKEVEKGISYVYHEVADYENPITDDFFYGPEYTNITYDGKEFFYSSPKKKTFDYSDVPDAEVYSLNGEKVFAQYSTSYGTYYEYEGRGWGNINFTEKSADGKEVFRYWEYAIERSVYDADGRLCLEESYKLSGKLNSVKEYVYDENGRLTRTVHFVKYDGETEWSEYEHHLYTYDANGNIAHHSVMMPFNEKRFYYEEEYSYRTDPDGRLQSVLVKRSGQYKEACLASESETQYFYNNDQSVLQVNRGMAASYADDGTEIFNYYGMQYFPTKLQSEYLLSGRDPDTIENDEETRELIKSGNMEKNASAGTASDYTFKTEETWVDITYKNGLLVHYINRGYSGSECFYEYNSAKKCTHKYGWEGYCGKFDSRYSYDSAGNLIKEENKGTTESAVGSPFTASGEDDYSHEQNVVSVVQYKYDKNGNRTSMENKVTVKGALRGNIKESYDSEGFLVSSETNCYKENEKWRCIGERIQ